MKIFCIFRISKYKQHKKMEIFLGYEIWEYSCGRVCHDNALSEGNSPKRQKIKVN